MPLPEIIAIREDDAWLAEILTRVRAGGDIVLAKAGEPYARLVRLEPLVPRADAPPPEFHELVGQEGFVMMRKPDAPEKSGNP